MSNEPIAGTLFDPLAYGAYFDGTRDDSAALLRLAGILTDANGPTKGNGGTLVLSGKPTIAATMSLPASVDLFVLPGTRATAASGVTVTVPGVVSCAESTATIFVGSGTWSLTGTVAQAGSGALVRLAQVVADGTSGTLTLPYGGGYSEIEAVVEGVGAAAATEVQLLLRLNGDSTSGDYAYQLTPAQGASVSTAASFSAQTSIQLGIVPAASAPAGYPGAAKVTITHPDGTTRHKVVLGTSHARYQSSDAGQTNLSNGVWESTAAVTSVAFLLSSGNWAAGSVATLYGRV